MSQARVGSGVASRAEIAGDGGSWAFGGWSSTGPELTKYARFATFQRFVNVLLEWTERWAFG